MFNMTKHNEYANNEIISRFSRWPLKVLYSSAVLTQKILKSTKVIKGLTD